MAEEKDPRVKLIGDTNEALLALVEDLNALCLARDVFEYSEIEIRSALECRIDELHGELMAIVRGEV